MHADAMMALPAPPTGTATFLFTDIEGSTQRWDHLPDAMRVALERHNAAAARRDRRRADDG